MPKKLAIEEVSKKFEKHGYKLLSTEYVNNKQKLDVLCNKGHKFQIRFDMFSNGRGCSVCNITPKYNFTYVKECIEAERGYKLLSTEYVNNKQKLDVLCNKGHIYKTSFYIWNKMKHRCPICGIKRVSDNNRYSYEYISKSFENEGYKLLSTEYVNNKQKLDVLCNKGHLTKIRYDVWLHGHRCSVCAVEHVANCKRLSYDEVKQRFEEQNHQLISKGYKNSRSKVDVICPNGHEWFVTYNNFQRGNMCPECSRNLGNHTSKEEKILLNI